MVQEISGLQLDISSLSDKDLEGLFGSTSTKAVISKEREYEIDVKSGWLKAKGFKSGVDKIVEMVKDVGVTDEIEDIIKEVRNTKLDNYFEIDDILPGGKDKTVELKSLDEMVECPICKNKSIVKYNYAFGDKGEVFYYCVKCDDFIRMFGNSGLKVERYTKCGVCNHNDLDNANVTIPMTSKLDMSVPRFKYCRNCRKFIKQ